MAKLHPGDELIFRVAIPVPLYRLFDYLAPDNVELDNIKPGIRLEVPFGKGKKIAFLLEIAQCSELDISKLKRVARILVPTFPRVNVMYKFAFYLGLINLIVILSLSPIARYFLRSLSLRFKEGGNVQTPSG